MPTEETLVSNSHKRKTSSDKRKITPQIKITGNIISANGAFRVHIPSVCNPNHIIEPRSRHKTAKNPMNNIANLPNVPSEHTPRWYVNASNTHKIYQYLNDDAKED